MFNFCMDCACLPVNRVNGIGENSIFYLSFGRIALCVIDHLTVCMYNIPRVYQLMYESYILRVGKCDEAVKYSAPYFFRFCTLFLSFPQNLCNNSDQKTTCFLSIGTSIGTYLSILFSHLGFLSVNFFLTAHFPDQCLLVLLCRRDKVI